MIDALKRKKHKSTGLIEAYASKTEAWGYSFSKDRTRKEFFDE